MWVSAKFGTCTVVSVNGTLVECWSYNVHIHPRYSTWETIWINCPHLLYVQRYQSIWCVRPWKKGMFSVIVHSSATQPLVAGVCTLYIVQTLLYIMRCWKLLQHILGMCVHHIRGLHKCCRALESNIRRGVGGGGTQTNHCIILRQVTITTLRVLDIG